MDTHVQTVVRTRYLVNLRHPLKGRWIGLSSKCGDTNRPAISKGGRGTQPVTFLRKVDVKVRIAETHNQLGGNPLDNRNRRLCARTVGEAVKVQ